MDYVHSIISSTFDSCQFLSFRVSSNIVHQSDGCANQVTIDLNLIVAVNPHRGLITTETCLSLVTPMYICTMYATKSFLSHVHLKSCSISQRFPIKTESDVTCYDQQSCLQETRVLTTYKYRVILMRH